MLLRILITGSAEVTGSAISGQLLICETMAIICESVNAILKHVCDITDLFRSELDPRIRRDSVETRRGEEDEGWCFNNPMFSPQIHPSGGLFTDSADDQRT